MNTVTAVDRELRGARLPPIARSVLTYLAGSVDAAGTCYPALETIAWAVGVSRRSAVDAVGYLVRHELVRADVHKSGGKSGAWTLYHVIPERVRDALTKHALRAPKPAQRRSPRAPSGGVGSGADPALLPGDRAVQDLPCSTPVSGAGSALLSGADPATEQGRSCTASGAGSAPEDLQIRSPEKIPPTPQGGREVEKSGPAGEPRCPGEPLVLTSPTPAEDRTAGDVDRVWNRWLEGRRLVVGRGPAPVLDRKRQRLAEARLAAHPLEEVLLAAEGIWLDDWAVQRLRETGKSTTVEFTLAMRDAEHVEKFAAVARARRAARPPPPTAEDRAQDRARKQAIVDAVVREQRAKLGLTGTENR